ncbi:MAG: ABC transporter substrate-binding protein, partial [Fibrobacterota bacterium]
MKLGHVLLLSCALATTAGAGTKIVLGQSCALTGPAKDLGLEMSQGASAFFKSTPEVQLVTKDDKYEPNSCELNTKAFLSDKVTALFGYVGTPTSKVAVPLAMGAQTVFFGAFTGAGFLSDYKANPYSFSLRASYDAETQNMVEHLVNDLDITKIGLFIQDDAFGEAGKSGVEKAV